MLWLIERRASASGFATSKVPNLRKEPNKAKEKIKEIKGFATISCQMMLSTAPSVLNLNLIDGVI